MILNQASAISHRSKGEKHALNFADSRSGIHLFNKKFISSTALKEWEEAQEETTEKYISPFGMMSIQMADMCAYADIVCSTVTIEPEPDYVDSLQGLLQSSDILKLFQLVFIPRSWFDYILFWFPVYFRLKFKYLILTL